jgi:site-specific DNA-cytosine methylase
MNVLSLFDGMSCGQIALERAGIKVDNYFASEIDKYAMIVTQHNYPDTIQLGDITNIKIKTLYLSEVMCYINSYEDNNIQSKFREWEVLYWLNKDFTFSAKIRTQKSNERQEVSKSSAIQRIEEIRFSNREMGSVRKCEYNRGSGINRERNDIEISEQLQCYDWWYDNDIYRRYKEENIRITKRKAKNRDSEKENFGNIKKEVFGRKQSKSCSGENQKSNVEKGCEGELFKREEEDRFSRNGNKEKRNGRKEENNLIDEVVRELCRWDETNGIAQDYWNILHLHKEEQVTVVEYGEGFCIFKGVINLFCGGSPCQGFSFAGKQLNFDDPRSKLFFEYVRLLNECKPKYFLLENVRMKKEFQDVISSYLGVEPIMINSSLVSAQNRVRLYWTNIPNIIQPEDKNVLFSDILEDIAFRNIPNYLYGWWGTSQRINKGLNSLAQAKSNCLTTIRTHLSQYILNEDETLCRFLTVNECERLQTVPDNYTSGVSNTQRYKMLGNGWTVDVITHILKNIKELK